MLNKFYELNQNGNGNIRSFIGFLIMAFMLMFIYAVFGDCVPASDVEKEFVARSLSR